MLSTFIALDPQGRDRKCSEEMTERGARYREKLVSRAVLPGPEGGR